MGNNTPQKDLFMNKEEFITSTNKELIESGNFGVIAERFGVNYVAHNSNKEYKGHAFVRKWTKQLRTAFPDIRVISVNIHIRSNDMLVWQRTLKGKHSVRIWGVNPSGKTIKWSDMVVSRFEDEKIAEEWVVSELKGELVSKIPKL